MAVLRGTSELLGGTAAMMGFTVGAAADYRFRGAAYATTPDAPLADIAWDYDPYGRLIARTAFDADGTAASLTRYVHDGHQLIQEIDALTEEVIAEYAYVIHMLSPEYRNTRNTGHYYEHEGPDGPLRHPVSAWRPLPQ